MDGLFTDTPDAGTFTSDTGPVDGLPADTAAVVTPEPAQDTQDPVDVQAPAVSPSPAPPAEEAAGGTGEIPDAAEVTLTPTPAPDYTALLEDIRTGQEGQAALSQELLAASQQADKRLSGIESAMPVFCVAAGVLCGILLVQVLSGYLRH